ncbi:MAG: N-glycosylase/DNA lyase [Candidatus Thermoplasmatota archaeon]
MGALQENLLNEIKNLYKNRKEEIEKRIEEFKNKKRKEEILAELIFCLLTPQSKAKFCWQAAKNILEKKLSCEEEIRKELEKIRFKNRKARYVLNAMENFDKIKNIKNMKANEAREYLVKNIKGMGYKEASHFLRNIGFLNFAILDRHILKNLKNLGIIDEIPKNLSRKKYIEIEEKMRKFSEEISVPMSHLDLLLWCKETGEVFK